ncbi:hypothetical protein [Xanthomonas citri]|uniref:hypothetical protein n=1 Tax=Xanthomonas citri TaxID=346 RepID=UPI001CBE53A2|nr:hypothetical protein [Xanthomonas citri]
MNIHFSNESIRAEWRKLGFYYDRDDIACAWVIIGSREGVGKFSRILRNYANKENDWISCHLNIGPYDYLEIGTWRDPVIDNHWIAGRIDEISNLASYISALLINCQVGDVLSVKKYFSPDSPYDLQLVIKASDFDPSSLDVNLNT